MAIKMYCSLAFLLLSVLSLQLVQSSYIRRFGRQSLDKDKEALLDELEELIKKHRSKPTSNVDLAKLKNLREKMGEVSDLMDDIYDEATGGNTTTSSGSGSGKMYKSCAEAYKAGQTKSGVYNIQVPEVATNGEQIYCDMTTSGGGWTVFQRRFNGSVDFYRDWNDYEKGFGNANGEYWLGLDAIHQLTKNGDQQLYITMLEFDGGTSYAKYGRFKVASASTKYVMTESLFSGPAGDGLNFQNNQKFSTKDQDNDKSSGKCAVERGGGWWYNSCMMSNLNGKYRSSARASHTYGFSWYKLKSTYQYFLKGSSMMIRPTSFV